MTVVALVARADARVFVLASATKRRAGSRETLSRP